MLHRASGFPLPPLDPCSPPRRRGVRLADKEGLEQCLQQLSPAKELCQEGQAAFTGAGSQSSPSPEPLLAAHKEPGTVVQP